MMPKITPCLWFDGNAEEAAGFYVSLLPDSRIDRISRSPADNPSTSEGAVLMVAFTLAGQPFTVLSAPRRLTPGRAYAGAGLLAGRLTADRSFHSAKPFPGSSTARTRPKSTASGMR